jgi:hypothetical protein
MGNVVHFGAGKGVSIRESLGGRALSGLYLQGLNNSS